MTLGSSASYKDSCSLPANLEEWSGDLTVTSLMVPELMQEMKSVCFGSVLPPKNPPQNFMVYSDSHSHSFVGGWGFWKVSAGQIVSDLKLYCLGSWNWRSPPLYSSVQFSCSVVSDSLRPHELQNTMPPCPSPSPGVYSDSCPSSQ